MSKTNSDTRSSEDDGGGPAAAPLLKSAPPPIHAVMLVAIMTCISLTSLPSIESLDEDATVEAFTATAFDFLTVRALAWIRLSFFGVVAAVTVYRIADAGFVQETNYLAHSKLRPAPIKFRGLSTQLHFTPITWNLLGVSFLLSGLVPLLVSYGREDVILRNRWILRAAMLTFETAAPAEMLVAAVVKYAIWPKLLRQRGPSGTVALKLPTTLMQHNACVFMVLLEAGMLGRIPVRLSDASVAPLYGICYVLFSWSMTMRWSPGGRGGPQFVYFFLDTTLGWTTTVALIALLVVLLSFFAMFYFLDELLVHSGGSVVGHLVAICAAASLVCRFRD